MKTHSNTHHGGFHLPSLTHAFEAIRSRLGHLVSKFLKGFSSLVTQIQIGKMQSVLQEMTDEQLEKIDLKRCDIRRHAVFLVTSEYDGL